jgi:hypothetical protein
MDCFYPGRVLVGPEPESEGGAYIAEQLMKEFGSDFEFDFSIADVLRANKVDPEKALGRYAHVLPFIGRVPEGAEADIAERIANFSKVLVGSATPDYLVRPAVASSSIDATALKKAIAALGAAPGSTTCGKGVRVGIVDSGVDPSLIPKGLLHPQQYDATSPLAAGGALSDRLGHGSLVARIVSETAPGAELASIRAVDQTGTISNVVAALYLARAAGQCDILNLSLSVSCAPIPCAVCNAPVQTAANIGQLDFFFQSFMKSAPSCVLVAASGNYVNHLTLPAAFDGIVAVGSFDYVSGTPISMYHQVPKSRFALAPGGTRRTAYGQKPGFNGPTYLHGTSFAAAFVSGFAAKVLCARRGACGTPLQSKLAANPMTTPSVAVLSEIDIRSDKSWAGYDPARHGLGAIRF